MNGIVWEHKKNGVVVIDNYGCFHFVRGFLDYPIGSEIEYEKGFVKVVMPKFLSSVLHNISLSFQGYSFKRAVVYATSLCLAFLVGAGFMFWNTPEYYIEVGPVANVELGVNRLGYVISTNSLNMEGVELLEREQFSGNYIETLGAVLLAIEKNGFYSQSHDGSTVLYVTVIADRYSTAGERCMNIEDNRIDNMSQNVMYRHCDTTDRELARSLGVSAGKILSMKQLFSLDA